jgi:GT2 family glycosyltransferase
MMLPAVTVVVATHDGREHLARCLSALAALDYPSERLRVVVVDNASTDGTATFVSTHFPRVRLIRSERNLGFAGGSNAGFAGSTATDFVATVNNDVTVSPTWLRELVRPVLADSTVGLCTGKLRFARYRLRVGLDFAAVNRGQPVQAWLDGVPATVEWLPGYDPHPRPLPVGEGTDRAQMEDIAAESRIAGPFSPWERARVRVAPKPPTVEVRLKDEAIDLGVWVDPDSRPATLRLKLAALPDQKARMTIGGVVLPPMTLGADQTLEVAIPSTAEMRPVIQNAGTIVFRDGRGRDRGAVLDGALHYYGDDLGQYDAEQEVFAGCGAGLLIRRAVLEDVGAFDDRFFAYYEDVDLCWRARLRGWRVIYAPKATARHVHRATTSRWSGRFVYYTERNRLMLLAKLAPFDRVIGTLARSSLVAARAGAAVPYRWVRGADPRGAWALPRAAALASFARYAPGLLAERARIQGRRRVSQAQIDRWLVE